VIIFPIYCKKSPQLKTELKDYIARYLIHESLVDQSKYDLTVRDGTNLIHTKSQDLNEIASHGKEFVEINIPRPKKILSNYSIELQIHHGILGTILTDKLTDSHKTQDNSLDDTYIKIGRMPVTSEVALADTSSTLVSRRNSQNSNVFIIHGHDMTPPLQFQKLKLLKDEWDINSIILMNQPGNGRTIIEKFEEEAEKTSYAFAILTPDDIIRTEENQYLQARPNVIFELGWFYGRVGRKRVCIMLKEGTIIHSDLAGVSRIQFRESICEKVLEIRDELKNQNIIH
jgi:predicted nucleotide-binding protein